MIEILEDELGSVLATALRAALSRLPLRINEAVRAIPDRWLPGG